ncbi:hypothetical protein CKAN_00521600 [Cinnamomum micranthum f. kanehirae]|uniref:Uncharacterized protein n=1 Tax=Cinnamomum micranthum f. kanehirae TaxID=337451 RepID=A0A443NE52_9MAGN|nr:hypothetical protein CKAN_00521600 [Cinnamomum micranthum f. kanehirae]
MISQSSANSMAQQEDGWPLGLQPLNTRVGLVRNRDFSGSTSFSTFITGSPSSSTVSSSDLDTESTGSFFPDKSTTLGNLIGVSTVLDPSGRTVRGRKPEPFDCKKQYRSRTWFCLCTKACANGDSPNNPPSLGHFLEVERRAANVYRRNYNSVSYEHHEFPEIQFSPDQNSLFTDGQIAPPQAGVDGTVIQTQFFRSDVEGRPGRDLNHANGIPILFSCMCGQPTN